MLRLQETHVLLILKVAGTPLTHEQVEDMAALAKYDDTPQGLRSRMAELERAGYVRRVDREAVNKRNRHCWRFELTDSGRDVIAELFDSPQTL